MILLLSLMLLPSVEQIVVAQSFAEFPGVSIIYYDVVGHTLPAVRRSMNKRRPMDPKSGRRVDALSQYRYHWRWHRNPQGRCVAATNEVAFTATILLPSLVGNAPAELYAQFERYRRALLVHEEGHVRYAWDQRKDVAVAIGSANCATMTSAAQGAIKAVTKHARAYDKATAKTLVFY